MIVLRLGEHGAQFGLVLFCLFLLGVIYNAFVGSLAEKKEGYTSLFVALGVGFTLAAGALFYPSEALFFLLFFAASGAPMIVGDIVRYQRRRAEALERMRDEITRTANNGNED